MLISEHGPALRADDIGVTTAQLQNMENSNLQQVPASHLQDTMDSDQQDSTATIPRRSTITGLSDLPPEITEEIAKLVRAKDLLALRLVSRDVEAKVVRTFAEKYFTTWGVLLCSKESLQAFMSIAANAKLGRVIKTLKFYTDGLMVNHISVTRADWEGTRETETSGPRHTRDPPQSRSLERVREYVAFQESGEALQLLTVGLARLRLLGGDIAVEVGEHNGFERRPWGWELLEKRTKYLLREGIKYDGKVSTVIEAIALSGLPVTSFTASDWGAGWNWEAGWHLSTLVSERRRTHARYVFSGLRELDLKFHTKEKSTPIRPSDVADLFEAAKGLEILSLGVQEPKSSGHYMLVDCQKQFLILRQILRLDSPKPKELRLSNLNVSLTDLADFLGRCKTSLQGVEIEDVSCILHRDAIAVFDWEEIYHQQDQWYYDLNAENDALMTYTKQKTGFESIKMVGCNAVPWDEVEDFV